MPPKTPPPSSDTSAHADSQGDSGDGRDQSIEPAPDRFASPELDTAPTRAARPVDLEPVLVETGPYRIAFSPAGAVPISWEIIDPRYTVTDEDKKAPASDDLSDSATIDPVGTPIQLIDTDLDPLGQGRPFELFLRERRARFYNEINQIVYDSRQFTQDGSLFVEFTSSPTESGLRLIKIYEFPDGGEDFTAVFHVRLVNEGSSRLTFDDQGQGLGVGLGPGLGPPAEKGQQNGGGSAMFGGRLSYADAIYMAQEEVEKIKLGKDGAESIVVADNVGPIDWAGVHNRYWLQVIQPVDPDRGPLPFSAGRARLDSRVASARIANKNTLRFYPRLELYSPVFTLEPGDSVQYDFAVFTGPKQRELLTDSGMGIENVLFFTLWGWLRGLCLILMSLLGWFYGKLGNWGLAIIAVVVLVRTLTLPLAQIQMKQQAKVMADQARLKPYMDKINEKYKDNASKRSEEMMKLYREHNVNPLGMFKGCIFLFIQIPIFIGLYRVLMADVQLRGAPFLWISDLSQPDRLFALGFTIPLVGASYFNLLPILTAVTQMLMSRLSTNPNTVSDPTQAAIQKQMMYMMPVMILIFTYSFPSGLVLYWFISNLWHVFQQQVVNKRILGNKPSGTPPAAEPAPAK